MQFFGSNVPEQTYQFQQDGPPPHFSIAVTPGGLVDKVQSNDLLGIQIELYSFFSLWSHLKLIVYQKSRSRSIVALKEGIISACNKVSFVTIRNVLVVSVYTIVEKKSRVVNLTIHCKT